MLASTLLREARRTSGLTQSALAMRMGMPQSVVARLERPGSNPTWETITRALTATGHELKLEAVKVNGSGLDLGQLRARLELSPAERLRLFEDSHENLRGLATRAERR